MAAGPAWWAAAWASGLRLQPSTAQPWFSTQQSRCDTVAHPSQVTASSTSQPVWQ